MVIPRCLGAIVPLNGFLYAVGGTEEMLVASRRLSRYDPLDDRWTELADMIEPRFDAGNHSVHIFDDHNGLIDAD